jgi:hypothetical protein
MMLARRLPHALACAWASPWTAFGLAIGLFALLAGARWRVRDGAIELFGGRVGAGVSRLPPPIAFAAITFGHVILATDGATLELVRAHEHVHVRQYERWGPLFVPVYLLSSAVQLARGRDPYRDNRFEREAYAAETR